jgi:hypothetical protein
MTKAITRDSDRSCPDATDPPRQDSRTFKELSMVWGGVTGQRPELLLEALVQAFWRGQFERDVRLVPGSNGDVYEGYTAITVEMKPANVSIDRIPGNFAVRHDGVVVKVGKDGVSRPTAERTEIKIYRDSVARGSDIPDWDGCYVAGAGNRLVPNETLRDFAAYKLEQWSPTTVEHRYNCWRIPRREFAAWYPGWSYAPLADLDRLWPPAAEPKVAKATQSSQTKRGAKPKYDWPDVETFVHKLMDDQREFRPWDTEWKCQADVERKVKNYLGKSNLHPAESTIRKRVSPMIDRWRKDRSKADN